ncbi:MAG: gas vesicle protein [Solirubrobacterales bacterium]|nr:gas vesicle protein [Solirubrobacterales bacterium]MBV9808831.1 gas vesicle protein [Solirubrobacterales bacterium]
MSPPQTLYASTAARPAQAQPTTLVDLIDRVLSGGVVVAGHVTLAVADIELIDVDIALLVAATAKLAER